MKKNLILIASNTTISNILIEVPYIEKKRKKRNDINYSYQHDQRASEIFAISRAREIEPEDALINFLHVDIQPRLIRTRMTRGVPEAGTCARAKGRERNQRGRGWWEEGRRGRQAKSPGKLVTLLTDRRLLKCPLKVLLLVASSRCDSVTRRFFGGGAGHTSGATSSTKESERKREKPSRSLFPETHVRKQKLQGSSLSKAHNVIFRATSNQSCASHSNSTDFKSKSATRV